MFKAMWVKIIGTVIGFFIIAGITGTWYHLESFWEVQASVVEIKEGEEKQQKTLDEILKALENISTSQAEMSGQVEELKAAVLTPEVSGRGTVGNFGFEDAFIDVNEYGKASMYLDVKSVIVTCVVDGIDFVVELPVRGSFRNREDNGHLIMFSSKAGDDLGISGIVDKITIGPVK